LVVPARPPRDAVRLRGAGVAVRFTPALFAAACPGVCLTGVAVRLAASLLEAPAVPCWTTFCLP
ncbi:MAG: hypothetical protein ACREXU_14945, partial [Gammaproteobacteria bacterium]